MVSIDDSQNSILQKVPKPTVICGKKNKPCILLAEDNYEMRALLALVLLGAGYDVVECPDGWSLLEYITPYIFPSSKHEKVDLIVSDIRMPGITGIEILKGLPQGEGYPPIVLITAFGNENTHHQAEQLGVAAMFDKPFEMNDLLDKVREIVPL